MIDGLKARDAEPALRFYHPMMTPIRPQQGAPHGALAEFGRRCLRWLVGWWRIVRLGASRLVLSLSRSVQAWRAEKAGALDQAERLRKRIGLVQDSIGAQ